MGSQLFCTPTWEGELGVPHRPPRSGVKALLFTETKAFCPDELMSLSPTLHSHLTEVSGLHAL